MRVIYTDRALDHYDAWMTSGDMKAVKKINALIKDIRKNGLNSGLGKPERLKYLEGEEYFSREITQGDRLVYFQDEKGDLVIESCRGHYDDK